jgi:hypothetical protein
MKIKGNLVSVSMSSSQEGHGPKISFAVYLENQSVPTEFIDLPFDERLGNTLSEAMKEKNGLIDFEL